MSEITKYRPIKTSFASIVRQLEIGDFVKIGKSYSERQSRYMSAKNACPENKFSIKKQLDGSFHLIKVA